MVVVCVVTIRRRTMRSLTELWAGVEVTYGIGGILIRTLTWLRTGLDSSVKHWTWLPLPYM